MDFGDTHKLRLSKHFKKNKFVVNNFKAQQLMFENVIEPHSIQYEQAWQRYLKDLTKRDEVAPLTSQAFGNNTTEAPATESRTSTQAETKPNQYQKRKQNRLKMYWWI